MVGRGVEVGLERLAEALAEGDAVEREATGMRHVVVARATYGEESDHLRVGGQSKGAAHGRGIETLHRRRVPAQRLEGQHEMSEGDHHLAVDPHGGWDLAQKGEGFALAFLLCRLAL